MAERARSPGHSEASPENVRIDSADPCISMHGVILTPMLQQSQMQGFHRLSQTPSLIADLEFEICSGSAGRGKLMQRESNGCIYAACFYFLLAQMHQSKMYIGFTLK